jgi:hypothetical protein
VGYRRSDTGRARGVAGGAGFGGDDCIVTAGGGYLAELPAFTGLGVLASAERGAPRGRTVRFLAGPGLYAVEDGRGAAGIQGRMDLAAGTVARLAPLLSLRAAVVPRGRGSTYGILAGGAGLRLH